MIVRIFPVKCNRCGCQYAIRNWGGALEQEMKVMEETLCEWDKNNKCPNCEKKFDDKTDEIGELLDVVHYGISSSAYAKAERNIEVKI